MRRPLAGIAMTLALGAQGALAEPVSSQAAHELLFSPSEMVLEAQDLDVFTSRVKRSVRQMLDQLSSPMEMNRFLAAGYGYYGAVAFPLEGDGQAPPTIIAQLNGPEAARVAAIDACQQANGAACGVAALLMPADYEDRELTLSQAATEEVFEDWDEGELPKFLAFSPSSHAWGQAKGPGASARGLWKAAADPIASSRSRTSKEFGKIFGI